ncbi:MarR family winged helix-turn-helix transcriptional regulator [Plastorhodobacter daqingensis]|uniref:MarR family winged helix-turn-helix transcriptional regulator n=1 Tax=Plastorhodobacter daqingensis TaxID=1387281 RepID=A0ABW2UEZ4_9RHOB
MAARNTQKDTIMSEPAPEETVVKTADDAKELIKLADRVSRAFETTLQADESRLAVTHWAFLDLVATTEPIRPFSVAKKLGISRQNANNAIKKLSAQGLVTVIKDDEAARASYVSITEEGTATLERIAASLQTIAEGLNQELPKYRTSRTSKTLRALTKVLKPKKAPETETVPE